MKLTRYEYGEDGVFGNLTGDDNTPIAVTLEHAYPNDYGGWTSKINDGSYYCLRGNHQLEGMTHTFETFQIVVAGHTDILFHQGNYNKDSEGCVLLGKERTGNMIMASALAFEDFMALMDGINNFTLTVDSVSLNV